MSITIENNKPYETNKINIWLRYYIDSGVLGTSINKNGIDFFPTCVRGVVKQLTFTFIYVRFRFGKLII